MHMRTLLLKPPLIHSKHEKLFAEIGYAQKPYCMSESRIFTDYMDFNERKTLLIRLTL